MNIMRKKPNDETTYAVDVVSDVGNTDYIKGGEIIKNAPTRAVLVASSSDLDSLVSYEAGTIAYTAGFQAMWQKSAAGTWVSVI